MDSVDYNYESKFSEITNDLKGINVSENKYLTEDLKCISSACKIIENVLLDGLNRKFGLNENEQEFCFWNVVEHYLTVNDQQMLFNLGHISTQSGLCRAWLRYSLNNASLFSHINGIIGNVRMLNEQYSNAAFLLKAENQKCFLNFIKDLEKYKFALEIDNRDLNSSFDCPNELSFNKKTDSCRSRRRSSTLDEGKLTRSIREEDRPSIIIRENQNLEEPKPSLERAVSNQNNKSSKRFSLGRVDHLKNDSYGSQDSVCSLETNSEGNDSKSNSLPRNKTDNSDEIMVSLTGKDQSLFEWMDFRKGIVEQSNSEESDYEDDFDRSPSLFDKTITKFPACFNSFEPKSLSEFNPEQLKDALLTAIDERDKLFSENKKQGHKITELQECIKISEDKRKEDISKLEETKKSDQIIIKGLRRETELLKHQLKKYIMTVQDLKSRDSPTPLITDTPIQREKQESNLRSEVDLYEQRLVELTELHADILEVNDRLQRELLGKDVQIKQFETQMEDITGPLANCKFNCIVMKTRGASPAPTTKPSFFLQQGITRDSRTASEQISVNLWIPCAFRKGTGKKSHHLYQIFVHLGRDEWNIYRRYSDFHSLHTTLRQNTEWADNLDFPNKRVIGKRSESVVEDRRKRLETYLRHVVRFIVKKKENSEVEDSAKAVFCSWIPFLSDGPTTIRPSTPSSHYYGL